MDTNRLTHTQSIASTAPISRSAKSLSKFLHKTPVSNFIQIE